MSDARLVPLAFALGMIGGMAGWSIGDHEDAIRHLPHQALLVAPLVVLAALAMRADMTGWRHALYAGLAGMLAATGLVLLL